MLEDLGAAGDEHPALAGRDRLGGVERVHPGVTVGPWAAAVPARAVGVGAILEEKDPVLAAVRGDRF